MTRKLISDRRLEQVLRGIEDSGFPYLKVELEGRCGRGYGDGLGEDENAHQFILSKLSEETRKALVFSMLYGDCETELTFTLPVREARRVPEVIEAFKALAKECGRDSVDINGAGMHTALLTGKKYPTSKKLNRRKIANFKSEVTKLLPALYMLATPGKETRSLGPRPPQVTTSKYSAINTKDDTCLEYRIFDPCYEQPEGFFTYLAVIEKTLHFYTNPRAKAPEFGVSYDLEHLQQWVDKFDKCLADRKIHLMLNKQMRLLKPDGVSIERLKASKGHTIVKPPKAGESRTFTKVIQVPTGRTVKVMGWDMWSGPHEVEQPEYANQVVPVYQGSA